MTATTDPLGAADPGVPASGGRDPEPSGEGARPAGTNRRGRATRERIFQAAEALLAERGLEMTLDDVARAVGATRMTVHRHTGGREALLTHVVLRESARLAGALREVLDADRPLDERLVDALTLTVTGVRARSWLVPLFAAGNPAGAWSEIDPGRRTLGAIWDFWRPYVHDPAVADQLREEPELVLHWLLDQVLVLLVMPDLAPDEPSVRRTFTTFVVPAAIRASGR